MIIMAVLTIVGKLIEFVFGWFQLPRMDGVDAITTFFVDLVSNGSSLISLFIHKAFWLSALVIFIAIALADEIWQLLWWIIHKIPFINIH